MRNCETLVSLDVTAMIHEIFMPALSSTHDRGGKTNLAQISCDKIEKGETVLIVERPMADMDVESFNEGAS
jgi:pyruvate dehydrogenase E2 component (dihydrolipoamide acetyltransferase)